MSPETSPPLWLWRLAQYGVTALALAVAGLAGALALGAADPPRAGPLWWQDDFKTASGRWEWQADPGARLTPEAGALTAEFTAAGQTVAALTAAPAGDFTLEVAAAQTAGAPGAAAYGLVFGWGEAGALAYVLVNANGYAEAGRGAEVWYPFQQWPHILAGAESNRVRVDVRAGRVTARINDEVLGEFPWSPAEAGRLGVWARGAGPARVVFSWVRVWAAGD